MPSALRGSSHPRCWPFTGSTAAPQLLSLARHHSSHSECGRRAQWHQWPGHCWAVRRRSPLRTCVHTQAIHSACSQSPLSQSCLFLCGFYPPSSVSSATFPRPYRQAHGPSGKCPCCPHSQLVATFPSEHFSGCPELQATLTPDRGQSTSTDKRQPGWEGQYCPDCCLQLGTCIQHGARGWVYGEQGDTAHIISIPFLSSLHILKIWDSTHTHIHKHTHAHIHMHTQAHTNTHTKAHMHMHTQAHMHAHTCTQAHAHTHAHTGHLSSPRVDSASTRSRRGSRVACWQFAMTWSAHRDV